MATVEPKSAPPQKPAAQSSWFGRNWFWVVPVVSLPVCLCGGCISIFLATTAGIASFLANSEVYVESMARATQSQAVQAELGTPIDPVPKDVQGSLSLENGNGDADFSFGIQGPDGSGRVIVVGTKAAGGDWEYTKMQVEIDGSSTVIDLLAEEVEPDSNEAATNTRAKGDGEGKEAKSP